MTLDWLAQLLGLPDGLHGHIEDTASTGDAGRARRGARTRSPGAASSSAPSTRTRRSRRRAGCSSSRRAQTPVDDAFRLRPDALDLDGRLRGRRDGRDDLDELGRSGAGDRGRAASARAPGCTSTPPTPARRRSARSCAAHFAGWERADSIVVNPHKWLLTPMDCSTLWTRRPDDLRAAFSLVPEYLRVSEEVASLSEYSPALGRRFRALKLWAVLRCYGREGLQERIREAIRLAALFEELGARRAGLGGRRAAAVLARLLPPRRLRRGERGAARARQRDRRGLPLAHEAERPLRAAARGRQRAHDRGRRAPRLGRAQAGSGAA